MTRGKGLDDLLLFGGQPRARARTFLPEGFNQSRTPCRVAVPGPTSSGLTLGEARARVAKTIERFVRDRGANAGKALVVRAAPGIGKTTATARAIGKHRAKAHIVVATKKLANELAAEHGYAVVQGRNEGNCDRHEVVRALGDAGHRVERLACGTRAEPRCPFRETCRYYQQLAADGPLVGAAEQLFNPAFLAAADLVVIDDADLLRAGVERHRLTVEQLLHAAEQFKGRRGVVVQAVRLLATAAAAATEPLIGADAWDLLARCAGSGHELGTLIAALPRSATFAEPRGDTVLKLEDVEASAPGSLNPMLRTVIEELPAFQTGEDFNSAFRISPGVIEVRFLKQPARDQLGPILPRLPILVLDATPFRPMLDHVLAGLRRLPEVEATVTLPPGIRVIQYASRAYGHHAVSDAKARQRLLAEVREARERDPVERAELEAVIAYKGLRDDLIELGFAPPQMLNFGAVRGSNALAKVRRMHVVGRPTPPVNELRYQAQVIHHSGPPIRGEIILRQATYGGQTYAVDVLDFEDRRVSELLHAQREDELLQTVHRARLLTVQPQGRLGDQMVRPTVTVILHTSHPVPGLRVTELRLEATPGASLNTERHAEAVHRIAAALEQTRRDGLVVSDRDLAQRAKADPRTVSKALETLRKRGGDGVGNVVETPISEGNRLGNVVETPINRSLRRLHDVPQTKISHGPPDARDHWEPCRGGCGTRMPPGQKCFECAVAAVAAWKANGRRSRS